MESKQSIATPPLNTDDKVTSLWFGSVYSTIKSLESRIFLLEKKIRKIEKGN